MQDKLPAKLEKNPRGQSSQEADPGVGIKDPNGHGEQIADADPENVPAPHKPTETEPGAEV